MIVSPCRKLWCPKYWNQLWRLSACKKSTSCLTSCLKYCKDIANLLVWELWECSIIPIKTIVLFVGNLHAPRHAKNQLHHSLLCKILRRNSKLVILGTLGMSGFAHLKWYYQLIENFCVYLQAKKQLHHPRFSGDIVKICKLLILDTLGKPGCASPKW